MNYEASTENEEPVRYKSAHRPDEDDGHVRAPSFSVLRPLR
jgi:hypothetical protein